jgi:amino acid transporter
MHMSSPSVSGVEGASAPASAAPASGLFVRKSSGLVREIGSRDAFSVATGGVNPTTNVVVLFVLLAFASNADLTWPFIIGAAILIPLALTYAQLVATMPRSGGDFVYASRLLHPAAGAFVGFGLMLTYLYLAGGGAALVGQMLIPQFIQALGEATHSDGLQTFAGTIGESKWWQFALTGLVVAVAGVFVARGGRAVGRATWWLFAAGLVGVVLLVINGFAHSNEEFRAAYDGATQPNAYNNVLAGAKQAGIETGSSFDGLWKVLPFIALFYNGFTQNNLPAGELKRPAKTYLRATFACLTTACVLMIAAWLALKHLTGMRFLQSASALSQSDPDAWTKATGGAAFTGNFYGEIIGSPIVRVLIAAGFMLGAVINPIAVSFTSSRLMFALSFDRLIPSRLADVRKQSNMPVNAALTAAAIVLLFAALTIFSTGFPRLARNALLMSLFIFLVGSLCAAILPYRRRDLYEASPKILKGRLGSVPLTTVVALLSLAIQGTLFYVAATNDSISGGYDFGSVATLLGVGLAGIVAYVVSRLYLLRSKGVNIDLAMKELPPD